MMRIIFSLVVLLFLCHSSLAETPAEVESAREAAQRHNESVEAAKEQLEREIARAKSDHVKAMIKAKERMIEDLRRAFRIAMRSDAPENSLKIADQIKRLESQIASLRDSASANEQDEKDGDVTLRGLDPRLVGIIAHRRAVDGSLYRAYRITGDGVVTVLADKQDGGRNGGDQGEKYQGEVKDGYFYVHFAKWTTRGAPVGRIQAYRVVDNGQIEKQETRFDEFRTRGFVAQDKRIMPYETTRYTSIEALLKAERSEKQEPEPVVRDEVEEPVDEEPAEPEVDGDTNDFFGIPIE